MPLRKWVKQTKSNIKEFLKSKVDGSDKGTTRPNTPSGTPLHTSSVAVGGLVGGSSAYVPGTPPLAQAPTSPPAASPGDADQYLNQPLQPTDLIEDHRPDMTESSPGAPDIGSQVVSTNMVAPNERTTPQQQVLEGTATDMPSGHTESDTSRSVEKPASDPQNSTGETSSRKGLTMIATGFVGSTLDALKFGPLQDISDMLQGFANTYIMEGTVKKEHEALQQRLQAMLKTLDNHPEVDDLPTMTFKIIEIRE
ncbi:unnamed protein product [Rhizoctonia solani]|uniref:Uncharacterized protein n=1 Tax=Rhizoctonia solani TaxID=456999 RepID=A0A8H3D217_9AGAM|nr:unnamed protein product [Rhizoctonia solani]